jgi:uncharacterized protein (DUF1778 family)
MRYAEHSVTIEVNPELERQLKQAAAQAGLSLNDYVLQSITQRLPRKRIKVRRAPQLSPRESELLQAINRSLSQVQWERYHDLVAQRQAETLTPEEQVELIAISDRIEEANAARIEYVAELARLRSTTLPALMKERMTIHP